MLLKESYTTTDIVYEDGVARLPQGPGLGLEPDWDKINHFTRD